MADQVTVKTTEIEKVEKGHIRLSMTEWDSALEPELAAGGVVEIGGSLFYLTSNDDIDAAGAWAAIANDTQVYIYYAVSGTTATPELSTTAPTFDTAKNGYYDAGVTKRCVAGIYKDASGDYTQKTIWLDRERGITYKGINISLTTDTYQYYDDVDDIFRRGKNCGKNYHATGGDFDVLVNALILEMDVGDVRFCSGSGIFSSNSYVSLSKIERIADSGGLQRFNVYGMLENGNASSTQITNVGGQAGNYSITVFL